MKLIRLVNIYTMMPLESDFFVLKVTSIMLSPTASRYFALQNWFSLFILILSYIQTRHISFFIHRIHAIILLSLLRVFEPTIVIMIIHSN